MRSPMWDSFYNRGSDRWTETETDRRRRLGSGSDLDRLSLHAHLETLLVAAVLAPVPLPLVDQAVLVLAARVAQVFSDRPLEEPFTAFTTEIEMVIMSLTGYTRPCAYLCKISNAYKT